MRLYANFDIGGHHTSNDRQGRTSPCVVVAGAYATRLKWQQFNDEWNEKILKPHNLTHFHTSSCFAGRRNTPYETWDDAKKTQVVSEAIEIIGNKVEFINSQIVQVPDFDRFLEDVPEAREPFPSAIVFGLAAMFCWAKTHADKADHQEAYSYTFEKGEKKEDQEAMEAAFRDVSYNPEICKAFRVPDNGFGWKRNEGYPPVQAADVVANLSYKDMFREIYTPTEYSRPEFVLLREKVANKYLMSYDYAGMKTIWDKYQASKT